MPTAQPANPDAAAPPGSLPDMMTALQRADAADNVGDAKQIAALIAQHYPAHAKELLSATPAPQGGALPPISQPYPVTPTPNATPATAAAPVPSIMPGMAANSQPTGPDFAPPMPAAAAANFGYVPQGPVNALAGAGANPQGPAAPQGPQLSWTQRAGADIADFARTAVAGAGLNYAAGGVAAITNALTGKPVGGEADQVAQQAQQSAQNSPVAGALGNVAGNALAMGVGGGLVGRGLGLAADAAVPFLSPVAKGAQGIATSLGASTAGRAALGAGAGAASGAFDAIGHGGSMSDVLTESALGAVASPIIGKGAELAIGTLAPAATRGWGLLAQKMTDIAKSGGLDGVAAAIAKTMPALANDPVGVAAAQAMVRDMKVDPDQLATMQQEALNASSGSATPGAVAGKGVSAPLSSVMEAQVRATVAKAAARAPGLGNTLDETAEKWSGATPKIMSNMIDTATSDADHPMSPTGVGGVQTLGGLEAERDAIMKATMDPIRATPVPIGPDEADLLQDPAIQSVLTGRLRSALRGRVNDAVDAGVGGQAPGSLPLDDIESIRAALQKRADAADPTIADPAAQARDAMAKLGADNVGAYGPALDTYGQHQAYIEGFTKGGAGAPLSAISGASRKLAQPTGQAYQQGHASGYVSNLADTANASPAGANAVAVKLSTPGETQDIIRRGYGRTVAADLAAKGQMMARATRNVNSVAPGAPVAAPEPHSVEEPVSRAFVSHAFESTLGVAHNVYSAVKQMFGGGLSDPVARKIGEMISARDPAKQRAALKLLENAGADKAQLDRLTGYISGLGGASAAHQLQGQAGY